MAEHKRDPRRARPGAGGHPRGRIAGLHAQIRRTDLRGVTRPGLPFETLPIRRLPAGIVTATRAAEVPDTAEPLRMSHEADPTYRAQNEVVNIPESVDTTLSAGVNDSIPSSNGVDTTDVPSGWTPLADMPASLAVNVPRAPALCGAGCTASREPIRCGDEPIRCCAGASTGPEAVCADLTVAARAPGSPTIPTAVTRTVNKLSRRNTTTAPKG